MKGDTAKIAAAGAVFFVITSLTIALTRFSGGLALIWPGSGLLAAVLLALPKDRWRKTLALFVGLSTLATSVFGFGPVVAFPLALVNVFEGFAIACLLRRLRPQGDWLESGPGFERMLLSVIAGTFISAPFGGLLAAWAVSGSWQSHVVDWASAHTLGSLLCLPLALLGTSGKMLERVREATPREVGKWTAHSALIALACWLSFFQTSIPLLILPIVPLMYTAFRCGRMGATLGLFIVAGMSSASLQIEGGYFNQVHLSLATEVQFLQFYLAVLLVLALPTSVALRHYKTIMAELDEKRALEGLVADHSDDALLNLDAQGTVRYSSPAGERLSGGNSLVGAPLSAFFDPLDEPLVRVALGQAAESPGLTRTLELAAVREDDVIWLETKMRAIPSTDEAGAITGYAVSIRDVTARKHMELGAMREAETDALTGLPNRRAFLRHIEPRLERAAKRAVGLAIIDLDHFKQVNDTHGHPAGDTALREVAGVMRQMSRPGRFFARLGGEEFALVAEKTSPEDMKELCEELRRAIAALRPATAEGVSFRLTTSIGMACITVPVNPAQALRAADAPLYAAKAAGRNRVESTPMRPVDWRKLARVHIA